MKYTRRLDLNPSNFIFSEEYFLNYMKRYSRPKLKPLVDRMVERKLQDNLSQFNAFNSFDDNNLFIDINPSNIFLPENYVANMA